MSYGGVWGMRKTDILDFFNIPQTTYLKPENKMKKI